MIEICNWQFAVSDGLRLRGREDVEFPPCEILFVHIHQLGSLIVGCEYGLIDGLTSIK